MDPWPASIQVECSCEEPGEEGEEKKRGKKKLHSDGGKNRQRKINLAHENEIGLTSNPLLTIPHFQIGHA